MTPIRKGTEPRLIVGRERRQSDRAWAARHRLAAESGHGNCDWFGLGNGEGHLVPVLYSCRTHAAPMFTAVECNRQVCATCWPEGFWENLKHALGL